MTHSIPTRFRAYQLGSEGSSFSYFANGHFTIIEGRLTELSEPRLRAEMKLCGVHAADTLQITSWDNDHCASNELERLLVLAYPRKIEVPGYEPTTDSGKTSYSLIREYRKERD